MIASNAPRFEPFPRLDDLVNPKTFELVAQENETPARPVGLFDGLLSGHVEVLLQDVQDHPEKYDPRLLPLLLDILSGGKKKNDLTREECALLDKGTLDFATYVPPRLEEKKKEPAQETKTASSSIDDGFEEQEPDVDLPEAEPSQYWWTR